MLIWRWLYLGLALTLYAIRFFIFELKGPGYLMAIESNCWIFSLFGFGYKYLNRPSSTLSYLSQAAYPVYIIHMFVLFGMAAIVLPLEIPVMVKFVGIVVLTGISCFAIYEFLIRRIGFIRPLFGLKWKFNLKKKVPIETSTPAEPDHLMESPS